mmetsp:Transcript_18529/g.32172  ORF Transcript_18529/g.32172 Transcript_18529/m.32172 type:complete len:223 (-) Transcript_18529:1405-2073(-)
MSRCRPSRTRRSLRRPPSPSRCRSRCRSLSARCCTRRPSRPSPQTHSSSRLATPNRPPAPVRTIRPGLCTRAALGPTSPCTAVCAARGSQRRPAPGARPPRRHAAPRAPPLPPATTSSVPRGTATPVHCGRVAWASAAVPPDTSTTSDSETRPHLPRARPSDGRWHPRVRPPIFSGRCLAPGARRAAVASAAVPASSPLLLPRPWPLLWSVSTTTATQCRPS